MSGAATLTICCCLLAYPARLAFGHLPEGKVYRAFHFPDHLIPTIDGDLSDWQIVGESYVVTTDQFVDLIPPADESVDDFSIRLLMGWNEAQNMLFVAAQIRDDFHQIDRPAGSATVLIWQDDNMSVYLDADHSGGQYGNFRNISSERQLQLSGSQAQWFTIAGPPPDADFFVKVSAAAWYALSDGPYTQAAFAIERGEETAAVVTYEFMVVPFDRVDMRADFLSNQHFLQEGEIIGFNVEFWDFDHRGSDIADSRWSLSGGQNAQLLAERFSDLILMPLENRFNPTAIQLSSWGQIKKSYSP